MAGHRRDAPLDRGNRRRHHEAAGEAARHGGLRAGMPPEIILASASRIRLDLLERAGVGAIAEAAAVDESALKAAFRAEGAPAEACAEALAELKAARISGRSPAALVIGADQMLDCN